MGIYSTRTITREEALRAISAKIQSASNDELSGTLFSLFADTTLFNFSVIDNAVEAGDDDNVVTARYLLNYEL